MATYWVGHRYGLLKHKRIFTMNQNHENLIERIVISAQNIRKAVDSAPVDKLTVSPSEGEWSVQETLAHVRNVAVLVYGLRLRRLFNEDDPLFADYDEECFLQTAVLQQQPISDIVQTIVAEHEQTARLLSTLADKSWHRSGRHPESGTMSIEFLARRIAEHAEEHNQQIINSLSLLSK
jgi:hypothetical protein